MPLRMAAWTVAQWKRGHGHSHPRTQAETATIVKKYDIFGLNVDTVKTLIIVTHPPAKVTRLYKNNRNNTRMTQTPKE